MRDREEERPEDEDRQRQTARVERIIYASTLSADDALNTRSITSVEFRVEGDATVQVLTESAVFRDGQEQPSWRVQGTGDCLTRPGKTLEALPPTR